MNTDSPLLSIESLNVRFKTDSGIVPAIQDLNLTLHRGEVLGLIGESGSGKSVTLRSILRLLPKRRAEISGRILFEQNDVLSFGKRALSAYRGDDVSMIFQEPATSLDPVFTIGKQISEAIVKHTDLSRQQARERALEMLKLVRIPSPESRLSNYPHEMSGGMRQRAMIALALSCEPRVLLADEPTTALDATVQIQVILLLRELQARMGMATIFVTHDVGVAAEISDRIAVMYAGRIVETGTASQVLSAPRHPYTRGLLGSTVNGAARGKKIHAIPGVPPDLSRLPGGCAFAPRCQNSTDACERSIPPLQTEADSRQVACLRLDEISS